MEKDAMQYVRSIKDKRHKKADDGGESASDGEDEKDEDSNERVEVGSNSNGVSKASSPAKESDAENDRGPS
jgi:hypothetical protein